MGEEKRVSYSSFDNVLLVVIVYELCGEEIGGLEYEEGL